MSTITQRGATGALSLTASGTFQSSADISLETSVGTRWDLADGREVILVQADSATTIAPGYLYQDAATVANHQNLTVTAVQAFSANGNVPATVTVTLGATAAVANQYAGGFLIVNSATGAGQTLRIASHPAAASAGSLVVTLEDAPNTALTTSSKVCLQPAHGNAVIISPITQSGAAAGVGLYPIAASAYGFLVSKGITAGLANGAIGVGLGISASATTAGAFDVAAATTARLGYAVQAGVTTEFRSVFVNL